MSFTPRVLIPRVLLTAGIIFCGSLLRADVIYSNFGPDFAYGVTTGTVVADGSTDTAIGIEFTPTGSNFNLSSIEFVASTFTQGSALNDPPDPLNTLTMSIFADNGEGIPGGDALETLSLSTYLPSISDENASYQTLTSSLHPELFSGTHYWLVMDGTSSETLNWDLNSTETSGFVQTNGTPGNWVNLFPSETNGVFEVDGIVATDTSGTTPEPQAWWLMAGGLAAIAISRRSRRFASQDCR